MVAHTGQRERGHAHQDQAREADPFDRHGPKSHREGLVFAIFFKKRDSHKHTTGNRQQ